MQLSKLYPFWSGPAGCTHEASMPAFDEDASKNLSSYDVRRRWPRYFGDCATCGEKVILYASFAHYVSGDW